MQLLDATSAQTTAQRVIIQGTLEFSTSLSNYKFKDSEIVLSEGSSIIVSSGKQLAFQGSTVKGCEALWAGIDVQPGGRLSVQTSTISDAAKAILAAPGSFLNVATNTFLNNHICIAVDDPESNNANNIQHQIYNNTFTSDATLLSSVSGYNAYAYAGILVHNLALLDLDNKVNTFSNLQNGIIAFDSKVLINSATTFESIQPQAGVTLPVPQGNGIYVYHTQGKPLASLTFDGKTDEEGDATFTDCFQSISSIRSNTTVLNCKFLDGDRGIYIEDLFPFRKVIIQDNYFEEISSGIDVVSGENYATVDISDNKFVLEEENAFGGNCIAIYGGNKPFYPVIDPDSVNYPSLSTFHNARIKDNIIYLSTPGYFGVYLSGVSGVYVLSNFFATEYNGSDAEYQFIKVGGYSAGNKIGDNELQRIVSGSSGIVDNDLQYGLWVYDAPWNSYYCNVLGNLENAMQFRGVCHTSVIEGNMMSNCFEGLLTGEQLFPGSSFTILGLQPNRGNEWNNNDYTDAHWQWVLAGSDFFEASQFTIHEDDSQGNSEYWPDIVLFFMDENLDLLAKWFVKDELLDEPNVCIENQTDPGPGGDEDGPVGNGALLHLLDIALMDDDTLLNQYSDGIVFNLQWALEEKFLRYPDMDTLHTNATSYRNAWQSTPAGELFVINQLIASYGMDTLAIQFIASIEEDRLALLDSLLVLNGMTPDSTQTAAVAAVLAELEGLDDTLSSTILQLQVNYLEHLQIVDSLLNLISPSVLPETVMKQFLTVLLDELIQPGVNRAVNVDTLENLIALCPEEAGLGSAMALGLITYLMPDSLWVMGGCSSSSSRTFQNHVISTTNVKPAVLHPNPGSDYLQVNGGIGKMLVISDLYGRIVHQTLMTADEVRVNTTSWTPGTYFVRIGKTTDSESLIWIKK
ncbi:MAG: T9SS type A sorting domain-containing protein [Saprospiraceae bacterium]